jgi:predicted amidohydrolase YtcJ
MMDLQKRSAELIFVGGSVITMEDPVEAREMDLAVADGKILSLGARGELDFLRGPDTKVVDAREKTLMPGFIDSHNHMVVFGQNFEAVDVGPSQVKSIEELLAKLRAAAERTPVGKWIKAWGYDQTYLDERRHPNREDLDRACPGHPVSLLRTCLHVMVVNSLALRIAGISDKTSEPEGGKIGREPSGRPDGLLYEIGAMDLIYRMIPKPTPSECARSLEKASQIYASQGITMVTEAGAGWSGNANEVAGFQIAWQTAALKPRVSMGIMEKTYKVFPEEKGTGLFTGFGNHFLNIGPLKFILDGGIGAKTSAVTQPYEGSESRGLLYEEAESLTQRMERAHRAGFQISVHAAGDRALDITLDAYETILSRYPKPHRHRIEHVVVARPDILQRLNKLGIIAVVQPAFLYALGDSYIKNLGKERVPTILPIRTMIQAGVSVVGSSDRPVTEGNPWLGIWSAVNRVTMTGQPVNLRESINTSEALKLYTRNGAYANFAENILGTLSPGKLADIIVLDQNPLQIEPSKLKDIRVRMTFVEGREVYKGNECSRG